MKRKMRAHPRHKRRKLKPDQSQVDPQSMILRMVEIREDTANDESATVEVVVATENPVQRYDRNRKMNVGEVLLMRGLRLRADRRQLPIVDSHDRSTVRNVLGSVRNLRVEGDELVGDASFARDKNSRDAFFKLRDGHITDFSITADPLNVQVVQRGEVYRSEGKEISGPANVFDGWMPTDASLVATGADERSTVRDSLRRSYQVETLENTEEPMDEEILKALRERGLPEDVEAEGDAAIMNWAVGRMDEATERADETTETEAAEEATERSATTATITRTASTDSVTAETVDVASEVQRALTADRSRRNEIQAICNSVGIERAFADELCDSDVSLVDAREKVIERMATKSIGQPSGDSYRVTETEADKRYSAARDGLIQRSFTTAGIQRPAFDQDNRPAAGHEDFVSLGLRRMSEDFVRGMGVNINRMAPRDIAMVALGHAPTMQRFGIQRDAYHSTGSFANLLLDAANKTLLAAYEEAPYTWNRWARQAPSTADFKEINRIRFSESPDLEMVPENSPYSEGKMSDGKESYKIEKFGKLFTITWETVVNDDLDAISRVPAMQGAAARRTQNKKVYEVLTDNAALSDSGALFNSTAQGTAGGHENLAGSGGAPSIATFNAGFTSMMTKKGLDKETILNLQPNFLIVPVALSATALQLVGSIADPSSGGSNAGNSNTKNIYGPNGDRPLDVVVEAQLDSNSSTAWYMAAGHSQIDTVELCFLQGEESPVIETEWDFDKDCYKNKIRQTFGVKAIDFRGLYKNPGA